MFLKVFECYEDFLWRGDSDFLSYFLAFVEVNKGRNCADIEGGCKVWEFVDVDFGDGIFSLAVFGKLVEQG